MTTLSKNALQSIIDLHEKMKGAYFYTPPASAAGRRAYETKNSMATEFDVDGQKVEVVQSASCSCKNVYYKMTICIDGNATSKDIRFIKKLLKSLEIAA